MADGTPDKPAGKVAKPTGGRNLRAAAGWVLAGFACDPAWTVAHLCRELPPAVRELLITRGVDLQAVAAHPALFKFVRQPPHAAPAAARVAQTAKKAADGAKAENRRIEDLDLDLIGTASASTALSAVLNFTAGIDSTGFYLETAAPQTFTLNTTTGLSTTLNAPVRFAKLPYRLNDDTSPRSSITANFVLTLRDPDNSGKIRLDELSGTPDLIDGTVSGQAALSLAITSDLPDTAAFPKIRTELALTWIYTAPQVRRA